MQDDTGLPNPTTRLLTRIERTPLVATVMDRLRALIDSGAYAPGSKLPSERELCEMLAVGRSTVRESLRAIEALGLIQLEHGRGAVVRDQSSAHADALGSEAWQIERVAEARLAIETFAASLAAIRRTDEELELLMRQCEAFERAMAADDLPLLVRADVEFHDVIVKAANPVLAASLKSMEVLGIQSRYKSLSRVDRRPNVLVRHTEILSALEKRDPIGARYAMERHLVEYVDELRLEILYWNLKPDSAESLSVGQQTHLASAAITSTEPAITSIDPVANTSTEEERSEPRDGIKSL
jgi:GntR family transcriptional repressor for pyruvate dehydrogenase complex